MSNHFICCFLPRFCLQNCVIKANKNKYCFWTFKNWGKMEIGKSYLCTENPENQNFKLVENQTLRKVQKIRTFEGWGLRGLFRETPIFMYRTPRQNKLRLFIFCSIIVMFKEKRRTVFEHHRKKSHSSEGLWSNSVTRQVSLNRAKISGKCHNRKDNK